MNTKLIKGARTLLVKVREKYSISKWELCQKCNYRWCSEQNQSDIIYCRKDRQITHLYHNDICALPRGLVHGTLWLALSIRQHSKQTETHRFGDTYFCSAKNPAVLPICCWERIGGEELKSQGETVKQNHLRPRPRSMWINSRTIFQPKQNKSDHNYP